MVDSARLQRECWSRNTENQDKSLSAEFQQGKPSGDERTVSIRFGRVGTSSPSGIYT
jgi:hypothetical protein